MRRDAGLLLAVCFVAGAGAPATACADTVVAELARDTPISAYGGVVAWSAYHPKSDRYRLVLRQGGKIAPARIAGAAAAFDVSLGPDEHGRVVALYTRCRTSSVLVRRGCDAYRYSVLERREHKLTRLSSPTLDEAWPVQWRDRIAFARSVPATGCDVPYVGSAGGSGPGRRLDPGPCAVITGMAIRGTRIVQVTERPHEQGTEVRLLRGDGGSRLLAHSGEGANGYAPFRSPNLSAKAVWLTREGVREEEPMGFLRIDLESARLTRARPHLNLAGRIARDERGGFWYVQGPERLDEESNAYAPFCIVARDPCRLMRASASPFSSAMRVLAPRVRRFGENDTSYLSASGSQPVVQGDVTRLVVRARRGATPRSDARHRRGARAGRHVLRIPTGDER